MKTKIYFLTAAAICITFTAISAQITSRERPAEWDQLVLGGRFMDRFQPIQAIGPLASDTWGAPGVLPRYINNGIEENEWSYWGGNSVLGKDGRYHLFVCRWSEDASKGHMEWPNSMVVHAVSDHAYGPYKMKQIIGKGHNPEVFRLKDGRFVIYVIDGYYISDDLNGPWESGKFEFDNRDRPIIEGLSNLTFAQREDGTYLMVCRGGGVWFSETGVSPYKQVTDHSVYPPVEGRFEDPVIWKTNIQYHLIVNDWLGRIAYYLRSKDGINWKVDPGEAYQPGIAKYEDGTVEDWFKYERIKVLQDEYGRAYQAYFAVIDTIKWNDLANDHHSSKNITIPLTSGRLITITDTRKIDASTKLIRVKVDAEKDFNPHTDMDIASLRFGAPEEVNYGRGGRVVKTEKSGDDLIITFDGTGNGIADHNFTAKLLGKTASGELLFGYARLPWINYLEPALSARMPVITQKNGIVHIELEIQNFGQVASLPSDIRIEYEKEGKFIELVTGEVTVLKPFEKTAMQFNVEEFEVNGEDIKVRVTINQKDQSPVTLSGSVKI